MNTRITKSTKAGWAKTNKYTYQHVSGLRVRRDVNTNRWEVMGASENDGYTYGTLWAAMSAANKTPTEWATY